MLIGKPGAAARHRHGRCDGIEVRGRDLVGDLMGRLGFTEYFYLLVTGREPTDEQRFFLDLLLVAIAEHGLTPTTKAARMTYDADPDSLQGAVAAGILGCGTVVLGTARGLRRVPRRGRRADGHRRGCRAAVLRGARHPRTPRSRMPGFGHPIHQPVDPRARRILALADEHHVAGRHLDLARRLPRRWKRSGAGRCR